MVTILMILVVILTCFVSTKRCRRRIATYLVKLPHFFWFLPLTRRQLSPDEYTAILNYTTSLNIKVHHLAATSNIRHAKPLSLSLASHRAYTINRAVRCQAVDGDVAAEHRYYIDGIEIHLPAGWEKHLTASNCIELIKTSTMPLVIALNGQTLHHYVAAVPTNDNIGSTSIEDKTQAELLGMRQEFIEEYVLARPRGQLEASLISIALLLLFIGLNARIDTAICLVLIAGVTIVACIYALWCPPGNKKLQQIHCLRGELRYWGLFGQPDRGHSNLSVGVIDLIYPAHWLPYIPYDIGQTTEIDIYPNRQVVRQGKTLSLYNEVKNFPLRHWQPNFILILGPLLVLTLLMYRFPPSVSLNFTATWLMGTKSVEVDDAAQLKKIALHVGDQLNIIGRGKCSVNAALADQGDQVWHPFDCATLYWNDDQPTPPPITDTIHRAEALNALITTQSTTNAEAEAIATTDALSHAQMLLLPNFTPIVRETDQLCRQAQACERLKKTLLDIGGSASWENLMTAIAAGRFEHMYIMLKPTNVVLLETLIRSTIAPFYRRETLKLLAYLNHRPAGGFLIDYEQRSTLISLPETVPTAYDNARSQWLALQRLVPLAYDAPFSARGTVVKIARDKQSITHITLGNLPDSNMRWRFQSSAILFITLMIIIAVNSLLMLYRVYVNHRRMAKIKYYYDSCFHRYYTRTNR